MANRVQCSRCEALVLRSTEERCEGVCMPCYMLIHHGLKPAEVEELKQRGYDEVFEDWLKFRKQPIPKIQEADISDLLNHYLPVVVASINGAFKSRSNYQIAAMENSLDLMMSKTRGEAYAYMRALRVFHEKICEAIASAP